LTWFSPVLAVVVFLAGFVAGGLAAKANDGSLAEWFAGLATTAAVALALYQLKLDRVERLHRDSRHQAEQVAVWISFDTDPSFERSGLRTSVCVRNPTTAPIFNVVVWDLTMQLPDGSFAADPDLDVDHFHWLGPILPPETAESVELVLAAAVLEEPWMGIAFTDSAGRHWIREASELRVLNVHPHIQFPLDP